MTSTRTALAALVDVSLAVLLAYLGFRLALWAAPCHDESSCPTMIVLSVTFVVLAIATYFGLPILSWKTTLGQRLLGLSNGGESGGIH
jgi:LytS/YehU family sensor histidine kinase